jgi:hypothetical protein
MVTMVAFLDSASGAAEVALLMVSSSVAERAAVVESPMIVKVRSRRRILS